MKHTGPHRLVTSMRTRLILAAMLTAAAAAWSSGQKHFAYTDSERVFTLEFKGANLAIFNYINLTGFIQAIEASDILLLKSGGAVMLGQVFVEKTADNRLEYRASYLVQPKSALGLDLLGLFQPAGDVLKVYISKGGRFYEMKRLSPPEFDSFFSRLSDLDMEARDPAAALKKAAIPDYGVYITFEESGELRKLQTSCLTADGINPPKVLVRKEPVLTGEARQAKFSGPVKVKVVIDRTGVPLRITFENPPPYGMSARIEETIRNGWRFLPATSAGDVLITEIGITLNPGTAHEPDQVEKH